MKFFQKVKEHIVFVFFVVAVIALVFHPVYYKELDSEISLQYVEVYTVLFLVFNTIFYFLLDKKCVSLVFLGEFTLVFIMLTFFVAVSQKSWLAHSLYIFDGYTGDIKKNITQRNIYIWYGLSKTTYARWQDEVANVELLQQSEIDKITNTTKNINVLSKSKLGVKPTLVFKKEVTYNNKEIVVEFK